MSKSLINNLNELDENDELEQENDELKITRYSFNSFRIERSIRDILSWESRGKIIIPQFQREFVWNYKQCCKFIESILLSLPIPDLFMFRERTSNSETFLLIDGLQRLSCIKQFVNGTFKCNGEEKKFSINLKGSEWEGITYSTLNEEDKNLFDDYSLKFNIFDSIEDKEDIKKLYMQEIFERINTGSEKLTDQEIRNAVYNGDIIFKLKEVASNNDFINLVKNTEKFLNHRCYDQELILRFLTYYTITQRLVENKENIADQFDFKINSSKKTMLSNYLYCCNKNYIDYKKQIERLYKALNYLNNFNCNVFNGVNEDKLTNTVNQVFAEALVIYIMNGGIIEISKEELDSKKILYWKNTSHNENPFYSATTSRNQILKRQDIISCMVKK